MISSNLNIDEKGKFNKSKSDRAIKLQEGVISSHNLVPNNKVVDPVSILKKEEKASGK